MRHRNRESHTGAGGVGCRVDALEPRTLLAFAPVGEQFLVWPAGILPARPQVAVAADDRGDSVVVWSEPDASSDADIYVQRYNALGVAQGGEFRVNTVTAVHQYDPHVAMDADGDFVIVWERQYLDSNPLAKGVYARRYDPAGVARGDEFRVNAVAGGVQKSASVACGAGGNFIVAWQSNNNVGSRWAVRARSYDAAGVAVGEELEINATPDNGREPAVLSDADGDFVVAWYSVGGADGSGSGVYAKRYDATGIAHGDKFRVNTTTAGDQLLPAVSGAADGDFVVTWQSNPADGSGFGVYAQRYDRSDTPQGGEFKVNTFSNGTQRVPSVACDADGDFVIAWDSYDQDGGLLGVYAQRYDAAGVPDGGEFLVNSNIVGNQSDASVTSDSDGDVIITWVDWWGGNYAVLAQRYQNALPPPAATVVGRHVFYNNGSFDGNDGAAGAADDGAVAADKQPRTAGAPAGFTNVTSYAKGLNGVMIDVAGLPQGELLTADDFDMGAAGAPASVSVRRGAGTDGSDRVTLIWRDYNPQDASPLPQAVGNGWLTVTVKANDHTGLAAPDVFSFGNLIGDTGDSATTFRVNALDLGGVKRALNSTSTATGRFDFNRDGRVNALDLGIVKVNLNRTLSPMTIAGVATSSQAGAPSVRVANLSAGPTSRRVWEEAPAALLG